MGTEAAVRTMLGIVLVMVGLIQLFRPRAYLGFRQRLGRWGAMDGLTSLYESRFGKAVVRVSGLMYLAIGVLLIVTMG